MAETRTVYFKGNPVELVGPQLKPGDKAPDFSCVGAGLSVLGLADTAGKARLFNVVPSLDTPVCNTQTRRFNEELQAPGRQGGGLHRQPRPPVRPAALVHRGQGREPQEPLRRPRPQLRRALRRPDQGAADPPAGPRRLRGRSSRHDHVRPARPRDRAGARLRARPQGAERGRRGLIRFPQGVGHGRGSSPVRSVARSPMRPVRRTGARSSLNPSSGLSQILRYCTAL